jgi:HD-GYP domain-containing protein (c-di-GMP phosphodiesterase class II)
MKKIDVSTLKPGIAFDKPVFIDKQNKLVEAFEALKESDIERLTKWNIKEVETDGNETAPKIKIREPEPEGEEKADIDKAISELKKAANARDEINDLVNNGIKLLTEAYEVLANEKPYQISNLRNLSEEIVNFSTDNPLGFIDLYYQQHNPSLYSHLMFSAVYGANLANALSYSIPKAIELVFSILLMDVGMVLLPASIRLKEGKLNESEKTQLQAHTLKGYQILTQFAKVKNSVALVALQHQEHYDGSGYPQRTRGEQISEYARLAAIVDSYSALLEDKGYRRKKLPYEAMKELLAFGVYRYDPNFMKKFLYKFSVYPVGSLVELSDKSFGMVVRSGHDKPMRPLIYIYRDNNGDSPDKLRFIHLLHRQNIYIVNPVLPENADFYFDAEMDNLLKKSN